MSAALAAGLLAGRAPAQEPEAATWQQVRPVLENRCLTCHGRDQVKSGFRLATAATFRHGGSRGPVIDAEHVERSRLLEVIRYGDPELAMPPTGKLPDAEIALLEAWVRAGAPWPEGDAGRLADPRLFPEQSGPDLSSARQWWAYRGLRGQTVPPGPASEHPVDAFLRVRRASAGLSPAAQASPEVLLRRVSFDLCGLPPTPLQRTAFLQDVEARGFDEAWQQLIERLLASERYGEHQGRRWLDLVRYAETNGYERDAKKTNMWRYRDWVVRAFNRDKPYDRFLIEQLAGDELATFAPELLDAAGPDPRLATGYYRLGVWDDEPADPEQAKADELADIVDTTGQVFLATSVGCARCHDHKADPISMKDYYAMTAFFNNVEGYGGGEFGQRHGAGATTDIADRGAAMAVSEREQLVAAVDAKLAPLLAKLRAAVPAHAALQPIVADARGGSTSWRYHVGDAPDGWHRPGFDASAWPEGKAGFGTEGTPGAVIGTEWRQQQIQLRTRFRLTEIPSALVLDVHHDEDVQVFLNGVRVFERTGYRTDYLRVQLPKAAVAALVVGSNVLAVSCRQTGGGQFVDVGLSAGFVAPGQDEVDRVRLATEAERWLSPEHARLAAELLDERERTAALPVAEPYPALVVRERGTEPPDQRVLLRGSAHAPGDVVPAAVPAVMRADDAVATAAAHVPEGARSTGRRLAFARWLVGDGRALTARVMANRLWQSHFGRGLCRTPGDFGKLGEQPTHPELLDFLARRLIVEGWSMKAMHRFLLRSRAYRMASTGDERALAADPRNDLFWRFPPRRLTAEELRDAMLAVSGSIHHELYGPSVYPTMPAEVLATASRPDQAWGRSSPEDEARRSLYVFTKRSLRMPLLQGFDQPDPDLPCSERFPTNVPTQALMTLNGAFAHRVARAFAVGLQRDAQPRTAQIERAIVTAFGREPDAAEVERHAAFVARLTERPELDELAALTVWCLSLLNLNEFLWID